MLTAEILDFLQFPLSYKLSFSFDSQNARFVDVFEVLYMSAKLFYICLSLRACSSSSSSSDADLDEGEGALIISLPLFLVIACDMLDVVCLDDGAWIISLDWYWHRFLVQSDMVALEFHHLKECLQVGFQSSHKEPHKCIT
uniref:Uncharacterized protein n=1 Tax=Tanacetum cinerariifolium TaxID=118510 RepID=A0A699KSH0_TANCI|nr:hypothetical protein [Tanacetum cinerariifolium]